MMTGLLFSALVHLIFQIQGQPNARDESLGTEGCVRSGSSLSISTIRRTSSGVKSAVSLHAASVGNPS